MKKIVVFVFLSTVLSLGGYSQKTELCSKCLGTGVIACPNCSGNGTVIMTFFDPYYGYYNQTVVCPNCKGNGTVVCYACNGQGYKYPVAFDRDSFSKVKITNTPKHSGCGCTTYIGYKRDGLNQFKGACENIVNGHICGHSPKAHGLTEY